MSIFGEEWHGRSGEVAAKSPLAASGSKDLIDGVNRPLRTDLPYAYSEQTIEERVLRRGGLEARQCAKIVVRVIAHAGKCHVDQGAVIRLERHPHIEIEGPIGLGRDTVAAAPEH